MRASLVLLTALPALAAEPTVNPEQLPRAQATPPAAAVATCDVRPGFRLELMASEPLVADPIAMAFDEDSRLYVIEMIDYSERRDEKLGRVTATEVMIAPQRLPPAFRGPRRSPAGTAAYS